MEHSFPYPKQKILLMKILTFRSYRCLRENHRKHSPRTKTTWNGMWRNDMNTEER